MALYKCAVLKLCMVSDCFIICDVYLLLNMYFLVDESMILMFLPDLESMTINASPTGNV